MSALRFAALVVVAVGCPASAGVVINEVMYHPPDDLDSAQFVELHNAGSTTADISGWKLGKGIRYVFPAGTKVEAGGFVTVCKDMKSFKKHYGTDAAGQFEGTLSHGGDRIDLVDATGATVESLRYKTRQPWPVAPDGYSSSLERICPTGRADDPTNWAPSPLPNGSPKPMGTPGKRNANYSPRVPPAVSNVRTIPSHAGPNQAIKVEADVVSSGMRTVELCYRVAGSGFESAEKTVPMTKSAAGRYEATVPGQDANRILRIRVRAVDESGGIRLYPNENEVCPAVSVFVHEAFPPSKVPFGYVVNVGAEVFRLAQRDQGRGYGAPPSPEPPPRGQSAYVHVSEKTGQPELFDFVNVTPRSAGRKVRLHKHQSLDGMTTLNLIYEYLDRFVLAEPLAYELYRKAGNAACRTDFVRTWIDGRPIGYQLLIEQPNKSFLRHNGLKTDGNLYKCVWFGEGVVGQHEKKTHLDTGHEDLVQVVDQLKKTRGDNQWAAIKKEFDAEQFINYFAVNMVLSHWDGYFNNYFAYHDVTGTGKWTIYPWDQDKTWGYHDGLADRPEVFVDMPLTFGMQGDSPPGWPKLLPPPPGFGFGAPWWRPGGHFSKPMLANPTFRKHFLARTKDILENIYTEEVFTPLIDKTGDRLEDEVRYRAKLRGENEDQAVKTLRRNLGLLKEHLTKRRKWLLAQPELQKAGKFERVELK